MTTEPEEDEDRDDEIDDNDATTDCPSEWESAYERMEDARDVDSSGHQRYSRRDSSTSDCRDV